MVVKRGGIGVLCAAALIGCGQRPDLGLRPDGGVDPERPDAGPIQSADELYSGGQVPVFHLTLSAEAIASLEESPKRYVTGDFQYRDTTLLGVGVRLKGSATLQLFDRKPAFKIKFNHSEAGARFLGLESLTLNNLHQDPSKVREWLAYQVFRAAGVHAPRTGYAEVFVNGESYGLYLNLESIDDVFLAGHFADPSGSLYEGTYGDDLHTSHVDNFEQDEGDDTSRDDLRALVAAAHEEGDAIFYGEAELLDTEEFLAMAAVEAVIGHWDGYWIAHNYRIYHEPTLDQWSFIPWGTDQTLRDHLEVFDSNGYLTARCRQSPRCLVDYVHAGERVTDLMVDLDLPASIDAIAAVIDPVAERDQRSRYSLTRALEVRDEVRAYLADRPAEVRAQYDCLDPSGTAERDVDGDRYGPCYLDCNDGDADISPDALEVCDGIDNDCDDYIDELPECPCPSQTIEGVEFHFCDLRFNWEEAAAFCAAQGHALARLDDEAQNAAVGAAARAIRDEWWWIGLSDRAVEGTFAWVDGAPIAFTRWGGGEPSATTPSHDCAQIRPDSNATWNDIACGNRGSFICRAAQ